MNTLTNYLHVGFVAPDNDYAGLDEAIGNSTAFIKATLGTNGLTQTGTTTVNGATWSERTSQRGESALVKVSHDLTVVITGSTSPTNQRTLAASLTPQPS